MLLLAVTLLYVISVFARIEAYEEYQQEVLMEIYIRTGRWLKGYLDFPPFWSSQYSCGIDFFLVIGLGALWLYIAPPALEEHRKMKRPTQKRDETLWQRAQF
jgi:hypothetical protein